MKQPNKRTMAIAAAVCLVAVAVMAACLIVRAQPPKFVPPAFDETAVAEQPAVPEELAWDEVYQAGMSFRAHVCGVFRIEGDMADVYLYSDPDNEVWLRLRVLDSQGNILGETGLIRPGECVQSVRLDVLPAAEEEITLKLMSYEPGTYYSLGAATVRVARAG